MAGRKSSFSLFRCSNTEEEEEGGRERGMVALIAKALGTAFGKFSQARRKKSYLRFFGLFNLVVKTEFYSRFHRKPIAIFV